MTAAGGPPAGRRLTNTAGNNYDFTGYEYDSSTQYNYAIARFEAGRWGRFMSPDPYLGSLDITNPQSLNRYSYIGNNPTNGVDPLGLVSFGNVGENSDTPCNPVNFGGGGGSGSFGNGSNMFGGSDSGSGSFDVTTWTQQPATCDLGCDFGATYGYDVTTFIYSDFGIGGGQGTVGTGGSNNNGPKPTCQQQRIVNAVPGSTLTDSNDTVGTSLGGHNQFGITVTTAQLSAAGFTPFNPFGHRDGYHNGNVFFQVHGNGPGGLVTQGHIDTFNPATGLFGFVGHSIWDVGIGTLLQHLFSHSHGLLDPKC